MRPLTPEMSTIDDRIALLGRGLASLRLSLGEGLLHLQAAGGVKRLGFPTLESYAREALGRTGRWAADVRSLARRLAHLPTLRAEVHAGRIALSKAELVARVATPEDEHDWVARARALNVRQLRAALKTLCADTFEDEAPARVTIAMTVDTIDAWAFECARLMVESVGARRGDESIEAILAEGLGELLARDSDLDLPSAIGGGAPDPTDPDERASHLALEAAREEAAGIAESILVMDPVPAICGLEVSWADDPTTIDAQLRGLAATLATRDLELGDLASRILDDCTWAVLRYASFDHYCRERIGLSPSSIAARVALVRRLAERPRVLGALLAAEIGFEAAALVARVSGPETEAAWVARARARTVKLLAEEVDAVELRARVEGAPVARFAPPDPHAMADVHAIEQSVIAAVCGFDGGTGQMSEGDADLADVAMLGRTTLRLSLTEATGTFWNALERLHAASRPDHAQPESFVAFLVRAVVKTWSGVNDTRVAYEDVYLRDRWRCASPVCRSRRVTPHHVTFRSHGGGESRDNLVALCPVCHLELVHGGALTVRGLAPERLAWSAAGWSARP